MSTATKARTSRARKMTRGSRTGGAVGGRPVHQHGAPPALPDALVAAGRGVALEVAARGAGQPGAVEEGADGAASGRAGAMRPGCRRWSAPRPVAGDVEGDVEAVRRQAAAGPLRPFDQHRAVGQRLVEADLVELLRAGEAVEVEMGDRQAAGGIGLDQREGRARHLQRADRRRARGSARGRRWSCRRRGRPRARPRRRARGTRRRPRRRPRSPLRRGGQKCQEAAIGRWRLRGRTSLFGARRRQSAGRSGRRTLTVVPLPSSECDLDRAAVQRDEALDDRQAEADAAARRAARQAGEAVEDGVDEIARDAGALSATANSIMSPTRRRRDARPGRLRARRRWH